MSFNINNINNMNMNLNPKARKMKDPADEIIAAQVGRQMESKREEYYSDLKPWSVYKERAELEAVEGYHKIIDRVVAGFGVLRESTQFTPEEKALLEEKFRNFKPKEVEGTDEPSQTSPCEDFGIDESILLRAYDVAMALMEQGVHEKARDLFFFLSFMDPAVYQYWLGLGMSFAMMGDHEDAILFYNFALPLSEKDCYVVMLWMADSLVALSALKEAKEILEVIIKTATEEGGQEDAIARAQEKLANLSQDAT